MKELKGPGWTVVKWVVRTVEMLLLLLVVSAILDFELLFEFVATFCFGWIVFLVRVIPQISLNWIYAGEGVAVLALALKGLDWILKAWYRHCGNDPMAWRMNWTVKIGLILLMVFPASIATLSMVAQIRLLSIGPSWVTTSSKVRQVVELSNLKQIGLGLKLYAEDHEGSYPKSLLELVPDYFPEGGPIFSRSMDGEPPEPYVYYPGHTEKDDPKTMVLTSPRPIQRHQGVNHCVVYLDGSGEVIADADFQGKLSPVKR